MSTAVDARPAVILLIEDDEGDQELTRRSLEKGKIKNDLHIVEDGEQALDYLFRRGRYSDPAVSPRPDLVLLDLNLPKIDGRKILKEIRSTDELKKLIVVILTTSKQEEDIIRSYEMGANSYITKPPDFQQFVKVVQEVGHYWFQVVVLPPKED
jgi:DNA-binding response OmpR family regulator